MSILVTGGLGYIGSHTVVELLNEGYKVIILDNLHNSKIETLNRIKAISGKDVSFYKIDATDSNLLIDLFKKENISEIIHFAGYKSVNESIENPILYYYNNLISSINLIKMAIKYKIKKMIFSSSATVYGNGTSPYNEKMKLLDRTNPYGETKAMIEKILADTCKVNKSFNATILRYFNPVGAHKSGLIGEEPNGVPNNLLPYITQVAKGIRKKLYIFGDNYETPDGTGIRDYIHVVDLAKGHLSALKKNVSQFNIYNLGTGKGTSVLEILKAGDIPISYADVTKAFEELDWKAELSINEIVRDAWNFQKNLK